MSSSDKAAKTKHKEPVASTTASQGTIQSAFGFLRGTVTSTGDIVAPDFGAWAETD